MLKAELKEISKRLQQFQVKKKGTNKGRGVVLRNMTNVRVIFKTQESLFFNLRTVRECSNVE